VPGGGSRTVPSGLALGSTGRDGARPIVPGDGALLALSTPPLGSLTELFKPPVWAGPLGAPLTAGLPMPAGAVFGVAIELVQLPSLSQIRR
jgi:hypothetical protein